MSENQNPPVVGDVVIVPHPFTYDSFVVCRVVKTSAVMWTVEQLNHRGEWDGAAKRKVTSWWPLSSDPVKARERIQSAQNEHRQSIKRADERLRETVRKIAEHRP